MRVCVGPGTPFGVGLGTPPGIGLGVGLGTGTGVTAGVGVPDGTAVGVGVAAGVVTVVWNELGGITPRAKPGPDHCSDMLAAAVLS